MIHYIFISILFVLLLASGATPAMADVKVATGEVTKVDDRAVTIKTDTGKTIVSRVRAKETEVLRGGTLSSLKDLKTGDSVWLTYNPLNKDEAGIINANPDVKREVELIKEKVARATRILNMEGLIAFSGHISARIPGAKTFFMQSRDQPRGDVKPADLREVDLNGKQIDGKSVVPDEMAIHAAVYRAREDVNSVMHIHSHYVLLPSLVGKEVIPVTGHGAIFGAKIPVYPGAEKITTAQEADAMVKMLGDGKGVVLRGHGAVVAGSNIEATVYAGFNMEENAKLLFDAYTIGQPIPMSAEQIKSAIEKTYQPFSAKKVWEYYLDKGRSAKIFWD
jgi:L-ribulose-5-phosphate 4-epimerase